MSANEKKLADFVLENASLIRDYSSQQIAGAVGVSQSSVVKFSQKLGYKGFTDLKLAVHESVVMQESSGTVQQPTVEGYEDELSLNDWLLAKKREALSSAAIINDNADVLAAIAAIEAAERIQVIGSGPASVIATDLAHKLIELGKAVTAESDRDIQLLSVATLGRKDCLLIISASGQTAHLIDAAKLAKKSGALVISITNQWANPLRAISDIRLYSVASNGAAEISKLAVAASQQHLVDMFYCSLKQRERHQKDAELLKERKSLPS
jgi:DNA-binding MurR/RpiR family transcriptional regulator